METVSEWEEGGINGVVGGGGSIKKVKLEVEGIASDTKYRVMTCLEWSSEIQAFKSKRLVPVRGNRVFKSKTLAQLVTQRVSSG